MILLNSALFVLLFLSIEAQNYICPSFEPLNTNGTACKTHKNCISDKQLCCNKVCRVGCLYYGHGPVLICEQNQVILTRINAHGCQIGFSYCSDTCPTDDQYRVICKLA